jgi:hypothetical protein
MRFPRHLKLLAAAGAVLGGLYFLALILVSVSSDERVLGPNQTKEFCGFYLDCHRLVTLVGVERTDRIGAMTAAGVFHIVTLRLGSNARRAVMHSGRMAAEARDDAGRRFARSLEAERVLGAEAAVGLPDTAIEPGGMVTTRLVFDLPRDAANPRAYVRDSDPVAVVTEMLMIGDEDSFLHARTTFALTDAREAMRVPRAVCGVGAGCDTVVRVLDVRRAAAAGRSPDRVPADGLFYILTVEIRARHRSALVAEVRDAAGRTYGRARDVEARLAPAPPGSTHWVFDLPDRTLAPRLELRQPGVLNRLIASPVSIPLAAPSGP